MKIKIAQLVGEVLSKSWSYIVDTFKKRDDSVPLEADPVGDFLDKKGGGEEPVEVLDEKLAESSLTSDVLQTADTDGGQNPGEEVAVEEKNVAEIAEAQETQLQPAAEVAPVANDAEVVSRKEKKGVVVAALEESESSELKVKAISEEKQQTQSPSAPSVVAQSKPPEKKETQNDGDVEGLLDIFRSERLELETVSLISKDLNNMSIYSLLEEGKQIAEEVKQKKKGYEDNPGT